MIYETWYVMEDGSVIHPREVKRDAQGVLRHKDGRAVAMRRNVPRSRSVDIAAHGKEMKPAVYLDREMNTSKPSDDGGIAGLRSDYQTKFGKKPFAGWDAATLREKIASE